MTHTGATCDTEGSPSGDSRTGLYSLLVSTQKASVLLDGSLQWLFLVQLPQKLDHPEGTHLCLVQSHRVWPCCWFTCED